MTLSSDLLWWTSLGNDALTHVEEVKLDFAAELGGALVRHSITAAELSRRLEVQPSYVSRLLKGDENCTVKTMAKAAFLVGERLHLAIAPQVSADQWRHLNAALRFPILPPSNFAGVEISHAAMNGASYAA